MSTDTVGQLVDTVYENLFPRGTPFVHNGMAFIRSPSNPEDWTYIELQGELQNIEKPSVHKGPLSGSTGEHLWTMALGEFTDDPKKPTFRIGNNLLTGVRKKLAKPMLVVRKEPDTPADDLSFETCPANVTGTRLRVLGVVREKMSFETRPTPIISSLPAAK